MKNDFFSYLETSINEQKLAHAFLVTTNNVDLTLKLIINYLYEKKIIKTQDLSNNLNLIIIEPDGKEIKTASIEMLQMRYATKPIIDEFNIYIIKHADKMNLSAANKLLKFLEEPANYIIGFLLVDINYSILPTIKSRCQTFNLEHSEGSSEIEVYADKILLIAKATSFEEKLMIKKALLNLERAELITIIRKSILMLESKLGLKQNITETAANLILLDKILHLLESNVNIELVFDKLCIEMR